MVKETKEGFFCEECGLAYKEKEWAEKCEEWCVKHHTCNIAITSRALR